MQVLVRDNNVDQALRVLKKRVHREGIFREMKQRGFYEKPSEKRVREKGHRNGSAAVVQARIDGREQPQGRPVEARPAAGHHCDEAVVDEGRGGHRHGRAFGLG